MHAHRRRVINRVRNIMTCFLEIFPLSFVLVADVQSRPLAPTPRIGVIRLFRNFHRKQPSRIPRRVIRVIKNVTREIKNFRLLQKNY